jgi:hypothetical protein
LRTPHYIPQLTCHRTGQAVVRLCGRDFCLSVHGTSEAKTKYGELIAQLLANGRKLPEIHKKIRAVNKAQAIT